MPSFEDLGNAKDLAAAERELEGCCWRGHCHGGHDASAQSPMMGIADVVVDVEGAHSAVADAEGAEGEMQVPRIPSSWAIDYFTNKITANNKGEAAMLSRHVTTASTTD